MIENSKEGYKNFSYVLETGKKQDNIRWLSLDWLSEGKQPYEYWYLPSQLKNEHDFSANEEQGSIISAFCAFSQPWWPWKTMNLDLICLSNVV